MAVRSPKVSIVLPIYNKDAYLRKSLDCILGQSCADFEIICVDDGSTDGSAALLEQYAACDARIQIKSQDNRGLGPARNEGLRLARGEWIAFLDPDDTYSEHLLAHALAAAQEGDGGPCDVVIFDYLMSRDGGEPQCVSGITAQGVPTGGTYSYRDIPNQILQLTNPAVWNKLYRRDFLIDNGIWFDELRTVEDLTFSALTLATAERIRHIAEPLVTYYYLTPGSLSVKRTVPMVLSCSVRALENSLARLTELSNYQIIDGSFRCWIINAYLHALDFVEDWTELSVEELYQSAHQLFSRQGWREIGWRFFDDPYVYPRFDAVRRHDYSTMRSLVSKRLIVSVTSYPRRMPYIAQSLATLIDQTRPADDIELWLAQEQFPQGTEGMPDDLMELVRSGKLTIRWCEDDLKSHKKYFYALQEHADDVVVCVDDDLLYDRNMLERLWNSYLQHPHAISAARTHVIMFDEAGERFSPYLQWPMEIGGVPFVPTMRLLATSGAGSLYPPHIMPEETFDKQAIIGSCFYADDLWLKAVQVVAGVPVVTACMSQKLYSVVGSQTETLYSSNREGGNDIQLAKICALFDERYGKGFLVRSILAPEEGRHDAYGDLLASYAVGVKENEELDKRIRGLERKAEEQHLAHVDELKQVRDEMARQKRSYESKLSELRKESQEQRETLETELAKLRKRLKKVRGSMSYKAGRALTYIPRKLRDAVKGS